MIETGMTVEFDIVSVLFSLNAVGWGIAWMLFRNQFSALSRKVDVLTELVHKAETKIAAIEATLHVNGSK